MKNTQFIVYIEQDEDGVFIGSIPSIPGCHAQGKTQEEMLNNLAAVVKLCLRNLDKKEIERNRFVGIQNIDLSYA